MINDTFEGCLYALEQDVIVPAVESGRFGTKKLVPVRDGRLIHSGFGSFLIGQVDANVPLAVDYYGFLRKSAGFADLILSMQGVQVRMIEAMVVHFASIKIEDVAEIAPTFVQYFPKLKNFLLEIRGFKDGGT